MKKVSIVMGIYNCESTMEESIQSIINQTYQEWELILCDDGSRDNTYKIAKGYEKKNPNIKVLKNDSNRGLAYSLNRCIENSEGIYIARMDGDDISLPDRLERQVKFLDTHPDIDILGTNVYYFDEDGVWGRSNAKKILSKVDICCGNIFAHPSVMIRKKCLQEVEGYRTNKLTYRAEDYDLWCRLYEKGFKGENLEEILLKYRLDTNAYKKRKYKYRVDEFRLKRYWMKRNKMPFKYNLYTIKPLIIGLIPNQYMYRYHKKKMGIRE